MSSFGGRTVENVTWLTLIKEEIYAEQEQLPVLPQQKVIKKNYVATTYCILLFV